MAFLGGDERKALFEIEAHLMAKHAQRARPRAVFLAHSFIEDSL